MRDEIDARGYAVVRSPELVAACTGDPWQAAAAVWGETPRMVERQPIRAVPHGRSFASTSMETPLHSDAQSCFGVAPQLQVMACHRPAATGGETVLLDTWALMRTLDASLQRALIELPRKHRFVFGDVYGPTLALRGDALVFTQSPLASPDPIGHRLAAALAGAPKIELAIAADEILVANNHRMLHGRRAFGDGRRSFTRLLLWTTSLEAPGDLVAAAQSVRDRLDAALRNDPEWIRERFGLLPPPTSTRLAIVTALLRGEPPGVLAHRHRIAEPLLYRWRDAALRAATEALAAPTPDESQLQTVLDRLTKSARS